MISVKQRLTSNMFRVMESVGIEIPALPRPTLEELQAQHSWINKVERDTSPTEAAKLNLATVLRPDENKPISSAEYERRIAPKLSLILGYQQAKWLVEHQDELPEFMALLERVYIDFSGLVVVFDDGYRAFPDLCQHGKRWRLDWSLISRNFSPYARVAVSSSPR